jgi:hypothetical protein
VPSTPIILGEGQPDETFFDKLIKARNLGAFDFRPPARGASYGNTGFQKRLEGLSTETGIEQCKAVIIVADNDSDPDESFQAVVRQLQAVGNWGVPSRPRESVKAGNLPPLSVLMLPWDGVRGSLDTLCFTAAATKRPPIATCVEAFVKCVKADGWNIEKLSKLRLRCLLSAACKDNPNTGLLYAWSKDKGRPGDLIPLEDKCFNEIADFLASFRLCPESGLR